MRFVGVVWRIVPVGAYALHSTHILLSTGRWNRGGKYGCLYTALTQDAAKAEWYNYISNAGIKPESSSPKNLVTLRVDVQPVLDLTSEQTSLVDPSSSFLTSNKPKDIEKCRFLADIARQRNYAGIIAPSWAIEGGKNLVIYIDGITTGIKLEAGSSRIQMNLDNKAFRSVKLRLELLEESVSSARIYKEVKHLRESLLGVEEQTSVTNSELIQLRQKMNNITQKLLDLEESVNKTEYKDIDKKLQDDKQNAELFVRGRNFARQVDKYETRTDESKRQDIP